MAEAEPVRFIFKSRYYPQILFKKFTKTATEGEVGQMTTEKAVSLLHTIRFVPSCEPQL